MTQRPDPRAELRAFAAVVLEMARVDPERRPPQELLRWQRDLAGVLELVPEPVRTNRDLVAETVRMHRLTRLQGVA